MPLSSSVIVTLDDEDGAENAWEELVCLEPPHPAKVRISVRVSARSVILVYFIVVATLSLFWRKLANALFYPNGVFAFGECQCHNQDFALVRRLDGQPARAFAVVDVEVVKGNPTRAGQIFRVGG